VRAAGYRLLAALLPALLSGPAAAQSQPGFDCNLYGPTEACDPYLLYPPGQELRLTIRARQTQGLSRAEGRFNTLRELFGALRVCWRPPDELRSGMELSARFSFKRDGSLLGAPRFTYIDKVASQDERDRYRRTVTEGIAACMPLPFAPAFGAAVAGRPLTIRYIDDRNIPRNRT
jgi:hypothetical protein